MESITILTHGSKFYKIDTCPECKAKTVKPVNYYAKQTKTDPVVMVSFRCETCGCVFEMVKPPEA